MEKSEKNDLFQAELAIKEKYQDLVENLEKGFF